MDGACPNCTLNAELEAVATAPAGVVAKLTTGDVALSPTQYHRGYTFFTCTECVAELHELQLAFRSRFLTR